MLQFKSNVLQSKSKVLQYKSKVLQLESAMLIDGINTYELIIRVLLMIGRDSRYFNYFIMDISIIE